MDSHRAAQTHIVNGGILGEIGLIVGPHFCVGVAKDQHIRLADGGVCGNCCVLEHNALCCRPQANVIACKFCILMDAEAMDSVIMGVMDVAVNGSAIHHDLQTAEYILAAVGGIIACVQHSFHTIYHAYQFYLATISQTEQIIAGCVFISTKYNAGRLGIVGSVDLRKVSALCHRCALMQYQGVVGSCGDDGIRNGYATFHCYILSA